MASERDNSNAGGWRRVHRSIRHVRKMWRGEVEGERERAERQLAMNFVRAGAGLLLMALALLLAVKFVQGSWAGKNARARGGKGGGGGGGEGGVEAVKSPANGWVPQFDVEAVWLAGRKGGDVPEWMAVSFAVRRDSRTAYKGHLLALAGAGKSGRRQGLERNRWAAWLLSQGRLAEAEEQLAWADQRAAGLAETAWNRVQCAMVRGDLDGALRWIGRYRAARPDEEASAGLHVALLQRAGQSAGALRMLERYLQGKRGDETALYLQAAVLAMQEGETGNGVRYLRASAGGNSPTQVLRVLRSPLFAEFLRTEEGRMLDRALLRRTLSERESGGDERGSGMGTRRGSGAGKRVEPLRPGLRG